jgi:hypothetical protein
MNSAQTLWLRSSIHVPISSMRLDDEPSRQSVAGIHGIRRASIGLLFLLAYLSLAFCACLLTAFSSLNGMCPLCII